MIALEEHRQLKELTTMRLGGTARYFCRCASVGDIIEALQFARTNNLRTQILGGGSNTIFSDNGFDGLVVKIDIRGIDWSEEGSDAVATVQAGEPWDEFVRSAVERGLAGIECLSGIPGSVGATPIQNVGAYGQEVKETIVSVSVLELSTLASREFSNADCRFSYRMSRFKKEDAGVYIVTAVKFRLKRNGRPTLQYPEVNAAVESSVDLSSLADGRESLEAVRSTVLALRRKKSMVIDPADPNTRSVGSFFLNPVVDTAVYQTISDRWRSIGDGTPVPAYPFEGKKKIPAAWLIERSGFAKGYKKNGAGISERHTLALVNYGGTTAALLELADEIQQGVQRMFSVSLEFEGNVIP